MLTVDRIKVFFGLCVQFLRLLFELLKSPFRIDIYSIFRIVTDVEFCLECLRSSREAFLQSFQTHLATPLLAVTRLRGPI